jgi:hypothetical protein
MTWCFIELRDTSSWHGANYAQVKL